MSISTKRTYSIKEDKLSLYTLEGRIVVKMRMSPFQQKYFSQGIPKEAELVCRKGKWLFNLVLDLPDQLAVENNTVFGVDLGENNLAATSSGLIVGGGKVRHERYKFLAKRRKLQSNGSQSAKQLLKKISGREARHMKQVNHEVSKKIIEEAVNDIHLNQYCRHLKAIFPDIDTVYTSEDQKFLENIGVTS